MRELSSAHLLCRELADQGVLSKRTVSKAGVVRGGVAINILRNRLYVGATTGQPHRHSALHKPTVDPALSWALVRAEAWKRKLLTGEATSLESIAKAEGVKSYAARLIRTAFLAPDLKRAILDGEQPFGLTLQTVMTRDVPLDWDDQRRLYRG